jgi:hypothetical protein
MTLQATDFKNARKNELDARFLVQHPEIVYQLLAKKKWAELISFAELVKNDAPNDLIFTDPALYRTLRKAITEIRCRGLTLNPDKLRQLAVKQNQHTPNASKTFPKAGDAAASLGLM